MVRKSYILIFLFLFQPLFSQDKQTEIINANDSLKTIDTINVKVDSTKKDKSDIDEIINYSAKDSVVFELKSKKMFLYNDGALNYKDLKLNSGIIIFDQKSQTLNAYGLPDTSDASKFTQLPLMFQGSEKYESSELKYNFKTRRGTISMGYSNADIGYYYGEKIKKVTPEVYFIKNGIYTTSEERVDPEYYFFSPKMKVIPKDKIIAQSLFLYIEGVPIFWIPFAILPNRQGRSSGLIIPTYGNDGTYGIYFSKFGYFWAMNDFMDLTFTGSIFTKGRYDVNARYRYALKYKFNGSLDASYSRIRLGEKKDIDKYSSDQWAINLTHNQRFNPTTTLDGNLSFVSGKSFYDNSTNQLTDLLRQNVVSNLTFSKTWEETPYSLFINYYRDQNLQNGNTNERFPSISFTRSESYPFRSDYSGTGNLKLYEYLSYSYSANFQNRNTKQTFTNSFGQDTTMRDSRLGLQHSININFSPQFQFFNIRPYFNYTELWYNKYIVKELNPFDSTVISKDESAYKFVRYFQTGVSISTKFIGMFKPNIFNITGIRHTIIPSVNYNYRPDFSKDKWGYYGSYKDRYGKDVQYSLFEREIFGGAPIGESQSISLNIGNIFEMKTKENDTTENKFQLFNFNAGANYNFAADSLKWSEIRTDFRTQIGNLLNIGGGATFNLYEYDDIAQTRVNRYLISSKGKLADRTSFNINLSTSFNITLTTKKVSQQKLLNEEKKDTVNSKDEFKRTEVKKKVEETDEVNFYTPVTGGFNYNYSEQRPNPKQFYKSSNISANMAFSFSEKWKFTIAASYDFVTKQISAPYITAYRDLKSWEMSFNWYPLGAYKGFNFQVKIKAPSLQDIKVTKQTNPRGVYY